MSALTGIEKAALEPLRVRLTESDQAPAEMAEMNEDGSVHLVPPRWSEQVARILAEDLWDHCVEPQGEVRADD
jgi:hypothetical protein